MAKFLLILQLVNQGFPLLIALIRNLEAAIPGQGVGEQKLAAARLILEGAYASLQSAELSFEELWPTLQKLIAGMVALLNATGWKR